jgi:hypothetical protein
MRLKHLIAMLCLTAGVAFAAEHANFSGSWEFSPEKSKNVGMMAQMKMIQTIGESDTALDVTSHTTFQGKDGDSKTHYDLTGNRRPTNRRWVALPKQSRNGKPDGW